MTKKYLALIPALCIAFACVWSCQKNTSDKLPDSKDSTIVTPPVEVKVSASIRGRILDEQRKPVQNATVVGGSLNATSDVNGYFTIPNTSLVKNAGFIKVTKEGYFPGSRTFIVHENEQNIVEVQLIPKKVSGTFTGSAGGNITVDNGGSVSFAASAIVNPATNTAYNGTVTVSAHFLNPTSPEMASIMPGDLRGKDTSNKEVMLKSYGMMVVELNGANGEKLQLADGKTASLTFPIPDALKTTAPATIPLWYFNDTTGLWKQEGVATKQGSNYVGTVKHFSFWNCDVPMNAVNFEVTFNDQNGNPLQNAKVSLTTVGDTVATTTYGFTDAKGHVAGKIPANTNLTLNVYSLYCNSIIYTKNVGSFTSDASLNTIAITIAPQESITITGSVKNCDNINIANAYVTVKLDGLYQKIVAADGNFTIIIPRCTGTQTVATVTALDMTSQKLSEDVTLTVSTGTKDAGVLKICDAPVVTADQFVNYYIIDNNDTTAKYSLASPADTITLTHYSSLSALIAFPKGATGFPRLTLYIPGADIQLGNTNYGFTEYRVSNNWQAGAMYNGSNGSGLITEAGATAQDYVSGRFTSTIRDTISGKQLIMEGNFRVQKGF